MAKREPWQSNRDVKKQPKLGFSICGCDQTMLGDGQKCPVCLTKMLSKRAKKRDYRSPEDINLKEIEDDNKTIEESYD